MRRPPEYQARKQPFALDLDIYADLTRAGETDDLLTTVDCGAVTDGLVDRLSAECYQLVEPLVRQ